MAEVDRECLSYDYPELHIRHRRIPRPSLISSTAAKREVKNENAGGGYFGLFLCVCIYGKERLPPTAAPPDDPKSWTKILALTTGGLPPYLCESTLRS